MAYIVQYQAVGKILCAMRMASPLYRILDKLESRNTRIVERYMIRTADAPVGYSRKACIQEGLHPVCKDRIDLQVILGKYTPEFSRAIIGIEVSGYLIVFFLFLFGRRSSTALCARPLCSYLLCILWLQYMIAVACAAVRKRRI